MIKNFKNTPNNPIVKKEYNQILFKEVAPQYDRITRILSCGQDAGWKKKLIAALPKQDYRQCLDIASGTGDITFLLAQEFPQAHIIGLDLTPDMITYAQHKNKYHNVTFMQGDMCQLIQEPESVDLVTGGYALRNAPDLRAALANIHRVLKQGGIAAFLDFSKPTSPAVSRAEYYLLKTWGSLWGFVFHRNAAVYSYIADSLDRYPDRKQLHALLKDSGFALLKSKLLFGGITEITVAQKRSF